MSPIPGCALSTVQGTMNVKRRLVWLTALQMMMVLVGFGVFLAIKQSYQQFVVVSSFREDLREQVRASLEGRENPRPTSPRLTLSMLALPLVLILGRNAASIFYRAGRKKRQIKRDAKALLLLERLQQGHEEPFSLYLRSFSQEGALKRRKGIWWYILIEGDIFGIDRETIDLMISSEVRHNYPMIAFGRPGDKLGAGRLPATDPEWKALVLLLMKKAKVIFIVPSTSDGVLWEMEQLSRYHYEKTILVMPPSKYYQGAAEKHWRETLQELVHRGISLPVYDPKGALFLLDAQGQMARACSFKSLLGGSRVQDLIRQIPWSEGCGSNPCP